MFFPYEDKRNWGQPIGDFDGLKLNILSFSSVSFFLFALLHNHQYEMQGYNNVYICRVKYGSNM